MALARGTERLLHNRRVLVADDDHDVARSLEALLRLSGHEVMIAFDGSEALELAMRCHPEVCLIDLNMPKLDGFELARRIRAEPWGARATLVAITGRARPEDTRETMRAGFDHHLAKPVDPDVIESLVVSAGSE